MTFFVNEFRCGFSARFFVFGRIVSTMPTYTYECKKCSETVDQFHVINAKPRIKCESCGGACKRLIGTGAGIIFKGSGFYETDYKTKSGKPVDKTDSGNGNSKSSEGASSKGESKSSESKSNGSSKKSDSKKAASSNK